MKPTIEEIERDLDKLISESKKNEIDALLDEYKVKINPSIIIQDPKRSCINCKFLYFEHVGGYVGSYYYCNELKKEVCYKDSIDCEVYEYKNKESK